MTQFEHEEGLSLINLNHRHAYSIHNPCLVKSIGSNLLVSKFILCDISILSIFLIPFVLYIYTCLFMADYIHIEKRSGLPSISEDVS